MSKEDLLLQIQQLIESEDINQLEVLLQNTPERNRCSLHRETLSIWNKYIQGVRDEDNKYVGNVGTATQIEGATMASIACHQFTTVRDLWHTNGEAFKRVLKWYKPKWLADFLIDSIPFSFTPYPFDDMAYVYELQSQGMFTKDLPPELWVKIIVEKPELTMFDSCPSILKKEFWYIFDYESLVNKQRGYVSRTEWLAVIVHLVNQKQIDRNKVLTKGLQAVVDRNTLTLSNYFLDIIVALAPTNTELINNQSQVYNLLNSTSSKAINQAVKWISTLQKEKSFDIDACIGVLPIVFSQQTKSVLLNGVKLVGSLITLYPKYQREIVSSILNGLQIQDRAIQVAIANFIVNNSKPTEDIKSEVTLYYDLLLVETKTILVDYLMPVETLVIEDSITTDELVYEPIAIIESVEDLIFFLSGVYSNKGDYIFEYTVDAVVRLAPQLTSEHIEQLLPVFDKSYKLAGHYWQNCYDLLPHWFLEWSRLLISDSQYKTDKLERLYDKYNKVDLSKRYEELTFDNLKLDFFRPKQPYFVPNQFLLPLYYSSLKMLKDKESLPLLSVPTIVPFYLEASTLIARLKVYEEKGYEIEQLDLQIALARVLNSSKHAAVALVNQLHNTELKALLLYFLGSGTLPNGPYTMIAVWRYVAMTRSKKAIANELTDRMYTADMHQYLTGSVIQRECDEYYSNSKGTTYTIIKLQEQDEGLKGYFDSLHQQLNTVEIGQCKEAMSLLELIDLCLERRNSYSHFFLESYTPHNIDRLLEANIAYALRWGSLNASEVEPKAVVQHTLTTLLSMYDIEYSEQLYLFLALTMLYDDKVSVAYAAEFWIKHIQHLDQAKLGSIIGELEQKEFVPIKRLCVLIQQSLISISKEHNTALEQLMTHIIIGLKDTNIKGFKTFLEVYVEVLTINNNRVTDQKVIECLEAWSKIGSTKKIALELLKN